MNVKALQQTINATLWGMNKPKLKRVWDNKQKKYVIVDKKGKEVKADELIGNVHEEEKENGKTN
jgi:hypothetical protein